MYVLDCSRDGNLLAGRSQGDNPNLRGRLSLLHPDKSGTRLLVDGSARNDVLPTIKISPDGQSLAYVEYKIEGDVCKARLYIMNMYGQERREIPIKFEDDTLVAVHWSPDGTRLALGLMNRKRTPAAGKPGRLELPQSRVAARDVEHPA